MNEDAKPMDLQTFVTGTITQLIAAVKAAQVEAKKHGARVVPESTDAKSPVALTGQPITNVEFDVAVTVTAGEAKKGGIGVAVAMFAFGGTTQESTTNATMSRIKFSIPVGWPLD